MQPGRELRYLQSGNCREWHRDAGGRSSELKGSAGVPPAVWWASRPPLGPAGGRRYLPFAAISCFSDGLLVSPVFARNRSIKVVSTSPARKSGSAKILR